MSLRPFALVAPIGLAALLLASPAAAGAQFSSYVAHPPRPADTTATPLVALSDSARRARADSLRRIEITNMKQWVDSAAIAAGTRVPIPADTGTSAAAAAGATVGATTSATTTATTSVTETEGLRAPDTATPLPTLLLGGAGAMLGGLALLRRRRG